MAFNTALSGLRAASVDLDVTGNNIANASTVGFKSSRVQFGDLYTNGFLTSGTNPVGDGVWVQDVQQEFAQGNISFTDNGLDLAISGDGFFILSNNGEVLYSRAGQFSVDKDGYVVNSESMTVQGYIADDEGNLSGVIGDLQIQTDNLAPRRTTLLESALNLDSRESVLEQRVRDIGPLSVTDIQGEGFSFQYSDGTADYPVSIDATATAAEAAAAIAAAPGVSASAMTTATVSGLTDADIQAAQAAGSLVFSLSIDGATLPLDLSGVSSLEDLADAINSSSETAISASVVDNGGTSELRIIHSRGEPLSYNFSANGATGSATVQGEISVTAEREVSAVVSASATDTDFESAFASSTVRITNAFNPLDQGTYNHATSTTIYDSLGNPHELTQFFVKEPSPGNGVGQSQWSIYLQIDGEYVGGTDVQPYTALFDQNGELVSVNGDVSGEIIVTDWTPKDANGDPNGADGPPADPTSVVSPIPEPLTSSAFVIDLTRTTQYGTSFSVNDQSQDGYTTGRLSGLDVSDEGIIFARYTNGQSKALGQVALATFSNAEGLTPVGDTSWVETFESGQPIIGAPSTGTLGSIRASSVEESNVDLSAELVNLIIAQRNYQANAKTIETADAVTQTIINLS